MVRLANLTATQIHLLNFEVTSEAYFHLPYRQQQGVVIVHENKLPSTPHYRTISRRINRLEIKINEKLGEDIIIALDSAGIKVVNRGEWMHHKWHVRKGYLKIHVAVDIKKEKNLVFGGNK